MAHVGVQTDKIVPVVDKRTLACQTEEVMEDAEQMVSFVLWLLWYPQ